MEGHPYHLACCRAAAECEAMCGSAQSAELRLQGLLLATAARVGTHHALTYDCALTLAKARFLLHIPEVHLGRQGTEMVAEECGKYGHPDPLGTATCVPPIQHPGHTNTSVPDQGEQVGLARPPPAIMDPQTQQCADGVSHFGLGLTPELSVSDLDAPLQYLLAHYSHHFGDWHPTVCSLYAMLAHCLSRSGLPHAAAVSDIRVLRWRRDYLELPGSHPLLLASQASALVSLQACYKQHVLEEDMQNAATVAESIREQSRELCDGCHAVWQSPMPLAYQVAPVCLPPHPVHAQLLPGSPDISTLDQHKSVRTDGDQPPCSIPAKPELPHRFPPVFGTVDSDPTVDVCSKAPSTDTNPRPSTMESTFSTASKPAAPGAPQPAIQQFVERATSCTSHTPANFNKAGGIKQRAGDTPFTLDGGASGEDTTGVNPFEAGTVQYSVYRLQQKYGTPIEELMQLVASAKGC